MRQLIEITETMVIHTDGENCALNCGYHTYLDRTGTGDTIPFCSLFRRCLKKVCYRCEECMKAKVIES
jgi:hypothetical protein